MRKLFGFLGAINKAKHTQGVSVMVALPSRESVAQQEGFIYVDGKGSLPQSFQDNLVKLAQEHKRESGVMFLDLKKLSANPKVFALDY